MKSGMAISNRENVSGTLVVKARHNTNPVSFMFTHNGNLVLSKPLYLRTQGIYLQSYNDKEIYFS